MKFKRVLFKKSEKGVPELTFLGVQSDLKKSSLVNWLEKNGLHSFAGKYENFGRKNAVKTRNFDSKVHLE